MPGYGRPGGPRSGASRSRAVRNPVVCESLTACSMDTDSCSIA